MRVMKKMIFAASCILLAVVLFIGIIQINDRIVQWYGDNSYKLKLNDMIIYTVYVIQLVVSAVLSWLVYNLSQKEADRDLNNRKLRKENAVKYIKNEINYNKSIITVLKSKNININMINRNTFKTEAWDKYNIILIDIIDNQSYNKLLSYYSTIQLFNITEIKDEVIKTIENGDRLFEVLNNALNKIK